MRVILEKKEQEKNICLTSQIWWSEKGNMPFFPYEVISQNGFILFPYNPILLQREVKQC